MDFCPISFLSLSLSVIETSRAMQSIFSSVVMPTVSIMVLKRVHQALGNRTPGEIYYGNDERLNQTCFASQKYLISRSVPDTTSVLSQESVQGAPPGQTQEIIHLKTIDFVLTEGYTSFYQCFSVKCDAVMCNFFCGQFAAPTF